MRAPANIVFLIAILACGLSSCGVQDAKQDVSHHNEPITAILEVPFIAQHNDGFCGPAALTAILRYWGDAVSQQDIADEVYLSSIHGSLSFDLVRYAEQRGFLATLYHGDFQDIEAHLASGIPLLIVLGQGKDAAGHYVVIIGYNKEKQSVILHDGIRANREMPYQKFMALWGKMDYITLRISPQELSE